MSVPVSMQIEGLRVIERRVTAHHLMKSGAIVRQSEAQHVLDMVRDARETLEHEFNRRRD